jgi:L-lactate dehydrogenase complex protein LldE
VSSGALSFFTTCLVDALYPRIGIAVVTTLERMGYSVRVPEGQTCCGLPFYNNGYVAEAAEVARNTLSALGDDDPVVVPSGSCAWMMRDIYPKLDPAGGRFAERVVEFSELVERTPGWSADAPAGARRVTYHPSCHLLRGLGVRDQPIKVLGRIEGLTLCPMDREEHCCGFGGTFGVRYPEVSTSMADDKIASAERSGAEVMVTTDVGCLMQLEGRLRRQGKPLAIRHLAEVLSPDTTRKDSR